MQRGKVLSILLISLIWITTEAAVPLWTVVPAPGSSPVQIVPENSISSVEYVVQNQSGKAKQLVIQPMPGIIQTTACQLAPKGQKGSHCTLTLAITGSALPATGVYDGPNVCQTLPNGSPDRNQCYRPSSANILHITRSPTASATITITPSILNFAGGNNGSVTIINSTTSPEPAEHVTAMIPENSNISIQSTTCGANLAIGASCKITFTAPAAEGPTHINIRGNNTNTANVAVTVTPKPMAILSVNPTALLLTENSTGDVTVTNDAGSPIAAEHVAATIPGGSNISVQSTTCGASLAIGASCTITFASGIPEGPTITPIAGDNTNTINVNITVTSQPQISITNPVQQARVVAVSGAALLLEVTNNLTSSVNADAITVLNKTGCANLSVEDSDCADVVPGGTCTLELTSNTPYVPCTITIGGSNTANNPTALIAFSYLGGLVFAENGGSGKVVIDATQVFTSGWIGEASAPIAGSTSLDDGVSNTNAIVADAACTNSPAQCAAQRCRDINADSDWYLPAINELSSIHDTLCSNSANPCNFGNFAFSHWSSSQLDDTKAWYMEFPSGSSSNGLHNLYPLSVRCTRIFTP